MTKYLSLRVMVAVEGAPDVADRPLTHREAYEIQSGVFNALHDAVQAGLTPDSTTIARVKEISVEHVSFGEKWHSPLYTLTFIP